jgi:P63C domain
MSEKILKATHGSPDKPLVIGAIEIPCYVLEDGTRVLSGRGMQAALALGQRHGALLKGFLSKSNIKAFINTDLAMALSSPIRFVRPGRGGKLAVGYEATKLVDICDALLSARKAGVLTPKQLLIAAQCEILTRAFAKVGIIALVDEVTGYQEIRDRVALQKILDKYLTDDWAKWTKTFPDEYYKELFRLKNVPYPPVPSSTRKPSYVGHWTNDIIYSRLAPGVLDELKKKNPRLPSGNRSRKFFQHLTLDYGHPELKELLSNVIFLLKGSSQWEEFKNSLNRAKPKYGKTLSIDFKD